MNITAEEAKQIMDSEEGYIILDVRSRKETSLRCQVKFLPGTTNGPAQ